MQDGRRWIALAVVAAAAALVLAVLPPGPRGDIGGSAEPGSPSPTTVDVQPGRTSGVGGPRRATWS